MGRVYMTNVRCAQLDQKTRKCHCYNAEYTKRDGNSSCGLSCAELGGLPDGADLSGYIIPGTGKFFRYHPVLNQKLEILFTK